MNDQEARDLLNYYVIRTPFHGHILNAAFIHAHHPWMDEMRVYSATPEELGLYDIDPQVFDRPHWEPLYLKDVNLTSKEVVTRMENALAHSRRNPICSGCTQELL
jgi:hypothetical protein